MRLGPWEIAAVLVLVLVVFGSSRLPALGQGIGEFLKNLRKSLKDAETKP